MTNAKPTRLTQIFCVVTKTHLSPGFLLKSYFLKKPKTALSTMYLSSVAIGGYLVFAIEVLTSPWDVLSSAANWADFSSWQKKVKYGKWNPSESGPMRVDGKMSLITEGCLMFTLRFQSPFSAQLNCLVVSNRGCIERIRFEPNIHLHKKQKNPHLFYTNSLNNIYYKEFLWLGPLKH